MTPLQPAPVVRGTVDVGGRTVGFRRAGTGPAVVVIGSLGHSSAPDAPLVAALTTRFAVVAVDPPGYGFSTPLPAGGDDVASRAEALAAVLAALGWGTAAVVGRHTGGTVASALTARYSGRYPLLVLDDVPLLDAATRARWSAAYGEVIAPRRDGTHLLQHWYRRRAEYVGAPWFEPVGPVERDLTAPGVVDTVVHAAVLDALAADAGHTRGHLAAFAYDAVAALAASTVEVRALAPTHAALGDPAVVRPGLDVRPGPHGWRERDSAVRDALDGWDGPPPAWPVPGEPDRGRWTAQLPVTPWGQVAVRRHRPTADDGRAPLVLLHASPLSGESLLPLADQFASDREVLVLDTLGNGDSDAPDTARDPQFRHAEITDLALVALAAVEALGVDRYDVYGTHTGALIALEMAVAAPERVRALVLNGVPLFSAAESTASLERYFVDLTPRWDATHLVTAWSNVVDVLTWYPWYARDPAHRRPVAPLPVEALHRRVVQMLKGGTSYPEPHRAVMRHRTAERLPHLTVPTAFLRAPGDPLAPDVERCVAAVPGAATVDLTGDHAGDARRIEGWLARVDR